MTIEEALREGAVTLASVADRPRLEAEILMSEHLGRERVWLHMHSDRKMEDPKGYFALVERRCKSEPIEYITGRVSFYDLQLEVGPGVLIARPETELLVDMAAKIVGKYRLTNICEIGVGSGAVSIMLAKMFPELRIVATDISEKALAYARKNVVRYGLEDRIELRQADLLEGIETVPEMIVSNPPYIGERYMLPHSLRYEPENALIGGVCGDELLQRIILTAKTRNVPHLVCEMGYDQRHPIVEFCAEQHLPEPKFYRDLAGLDRGFYVRMSGE
ncbi:peptide chain release factor N(5)-glutamine methyltransferase [Hydrogenimonas cancrithermarum]|uniref:peptide chain release factor N(5)-glutamine methyltransferase n=1 Tax=Hydrogenimonas cancrithermarum TaxID=2993563 RepID=A0ABN6WTW8_9BACT|nr:peptide chain release factor N(5)-glutamine methyltransferase [Hydrogenimonas cancrithermarum]BDY12120.1 N5-glutamine S-adenosyl-L-methionine-dependent methyltransferase [Hydrogenimonas cancrithermarum]